ncbi:MAG: SseB family protein [Chthoniobacter sp.]|nr:SseB family protein [Chthoniobacter sp.]
MAAINRQFAEFSEGEIDPLEGILAMFHVDRQRYLPQVLAELTRATIELMISENNPMSPPLMLQSADGFPMLAVFTQRRRTTNCQQQHPDYRFFIRLPFGLALESLRAGAGLVINPFQEVITWTLPPDLVSLVKGTIARQGNPQSEPPPLPPR